LHHELLHRQRQTHLEGLLGGLDVGVTIKAQVGYLDAGTVGLLECDVHIADRELLEHQVLDGLALAEHARQVVGSVGLGNNVDADALHRQPFERWHASESLSPAKVCRHALHHDGVLSVVALDGDARKHEPSGEGEAEPLELGLGGDPFAQALLDALSQAAFARSGVKEAERQGHNGHEKQREPRTYAQHAADDGTKGLDLAHVRTPPRYARRRRDPAP
jgi:hypothetical protein